MGYVLKRELSTKYGKIVLRTRVFLSRPMTVWELADYSGKIAPEFAWRNLAMSSSYVQFDMPESYVIYNEIYMDHNLQAWQLPDGFPQ